ncbi:MAG: DUF1801 domain-containing protein [Planctomycetota bacterium]
MKKFRSVDHYIDEVEHWQTEVKRLREIVQSTGLDETLKWSFPCYCLGKKNVLGIGSFKSYFGIWFFDGALMDDPDAVLMNAQEGKTKSMRQWRMGSKKEIKVRLIGKYIKEAIRVAESGESIQPARNQPIEIHPLLKSALANNAAAKKAFKAMRPGGQREYANYINEAKRDETKLRRIEKILPMIMDGVGLNDKYR